MIETKEFTLNHLIKLERRVLKTLGEAWVASGASCLCFFDAEEHLLFSYPEGGVKNGVDPSGGTCVSVKTKGKPTGTIYVALPPDAAVLARLEADVSLLSRLLDLEWEIEIMTSELIDVQDQILAMYQLTQSVRSHLDLQETLQTLACEAARLVKTDVAFLVLKADSDYNIVQYPPDTIRETILISVLKIIFKDGRELLISDPDMLPTIQNLFIVPVKIRDEVVAALGLVNKPDGFTSPDLKKSLAIVEDAGAQIEKVLLYQETLNQARYKAELDMAAEIQNNLLPQRIPQVAGLDIAGTSLQAKQVGGDFYDFLQHPGGLLSFIICDVAGKGMPSALLMAMTRTVLRTRAHTSPIPSPGMILTQANTDLYDDFTQVSRFTTAFVGQYNLQSQEIHFANGGHAPIIYCPKGEPARVLPAPDMPLGVLPDTVYADVDIPFGAGDILVVATDGFSEAINEQGAFFGYERLLRLVESLAGEDAHRISKTLFHAIHTFSQGHPQDDDQTLVVLKGVPL